MLTEWFKENDWYEISGRRGPSRRVVADMDEREEIKLTTAELWII